METRDWSLVFFTILTQAAVGAFLTLRVLEYLAAHRGGDGGRAADSPQDNDPATAGAQGDKPEAGNAQASGRAMASAAHAGRRTPTPLLVVLAVLSAGLFAALFHLSDPLQAARAVVNFSSSWLSREIVFGSLFAALLSVLVWHEWRVACSGAASSAKERRAATPAPAGPPSANPAKGRRETGPEPANPTPANPALATWLPRLAAVAGLAFLGCQTAIYLLPAQPAWNTFATPAAFGGTALRLGILGVAAGFVFRSLSSGVDDPAQAAPRATGGTSSATLRGLALAGIAALALEFVVVPLHLASLAANPVPAAAASVQRLTGDYGGILLLRLGLLGAAAAALGGVLASIRGAVGQAGPSPRPLASVLTCGAFALTVASEVCGRFLFYAMQVRVGI